MDKGSGSGIFSDLDPGDPKRSDPTGSGSATLIFRKNDNGGWRLLLYRARDVEKFYIPFPHFFSTIYTVLFIISNTF